MINDVFEIQCKTAGMFTINGNEANVVHFVTEKISLFSFSSAYFKPFPIYFNIFV